jgi:phosphoglycolate phosphatase-like HAD superfamily hydrolase
MHLCFDLDGTLIDFSDRLYCIYQDLLIAGGFEILPKSAYLPLKAANVHERDIIARTDASDIADDYLIQRDQLIEDPHYQQLDQLLPGVPQLLASLQKSHTLSLVTLRQYRQPLMAQLVTLDLVQYFTHIQSGSLAGETLPESKTRMIREILSDEEPCAMIGDSEYDILGGRGAGAITIAVETGIRDTAWLMQYHPDFTLHDVTELPKILPKLDQPTS